MKNINMINIVLADDHGIVRDGIKATLREEKNLSIVGEASNGREAIEKVKLLDPDILIIDISMPLMNGLEAARLLQEQELFTKTLILSMHESEEYVFNAIESGAAGYLLKDTNKEEFVKAINAIAQGEKYYSSAISNVLVTGYLQKIKKESDSVENENLLTKREKGILKLIVEGRNNREIANNLNISIRTIETHRSNIMKKLQVKNAIELLKIAMEQKLV